MKKIKQMSDKKCKLRRYELLDPRQAKTLAAKDYTCDEVRASYEDWKKEWRNKNGTDGILSAGGKDKAYEDFCKNIEDFLSACKCKKSGSLNLKVPIKEKIATAKKLRDSGQGPWQKKEIIFITMTRDILLDFLVRFSGIYMSEEEAKKVSLEMVLSFIDEWIEHNPHCRTWVNE